MTPSYARPRSIEGAHEIPKAGWNDRIGLIGAESSGVDFSLWGATRSRTGWSIPRSRDVNIDALEAWLPRSARRTVVPHVVDLIPSSSWCASLANMLTGSSWKVVRDVATARAGACEECGAMGVPLECHEIWTYDEDAGIQTLRELRAVCGPCHETHHLGFASIRGRYAQTMLRLAALNRLMPSELGEYEAEVFARFDRRSSIAWSLDLSLTSSNPLSLKKAFACEPDGWVVGSGKHEAVRVRIVGAQVRQGPKGATIG